MNILTSAVFIADTATESQLLSYLNDVSSIDVVLIVKNNLELVEKVPQKSIDILFISEDYCESLPTINLPPFVVVVAKSESFAKRKLFFDVLLHPITESGLCDVLGKILKIANAYKPKEPVVQFASEGKTDYHTTEENGNEQFMFIKIGKISHKLVFDELMFVRNVGNSLQITMNNGKSLFYRSTMKKFFDLLPDNRFARVNKSVIVNFTKVTSLHKQTIWIQNEKFSVSRIYIVRLREQLRLKKG